MLPGAAPNTPLSVQTHWGGLDARWFICRCVLCVGRGRYRT